MNGYVLQREDGRYVALPGLEKSYTTILEKARIFTTRKDAENDACGNETVVPLSQVLKGARL